MEYNFFPPVIDGRTFDLISYWDVAAMPPRGVYENVLELAKLPILAMLAILHHFADNTSCQSESDFWALTLLMNSLRRSMNPERVETKTFLELNSTKPRKACLLTERLLIDALDILHSDAGFGCTGTG